jgi:hypothetical protein
MRSGGDALVADKVLEEEKEKYPMFSLESG